VRNLSKVLLAGQRADGGWGRTRTCRATLTPQDNLYMRSMRPGCSRRMAHMAGCATAIDAARGWVMACEQPRAQVSAYFQSGFPHDHDQWISSAATGWATMGLAVGRLIAGQVLPPNSRGYGATARISIHIDSLRSGDFREREYYLSKSL